MTAAISPIYSTLGAFLVEETHLDVKVVIFIQISDLNLSLVCKQFKAINELAQKSIWKNHLIALQNNHFSIDKSLFSPAEAWFFDQETLRKGKEIKNSLLQKMSDIWPLNAPLPLDEKIKTVLLLERQNQHVHSIGIKSSIDEFNDIQQRYGSSTSLDRFIENENAINNAKLEMECNLELAWVRIRDKLQLPTQILNAGEIRTWMEDEQNQPLLGTIRTLTLSRLGLTAVPIEISYLFNLEILDLSINEITVLPTFLENLPLSPHGLFSSDNPIHFPFLRRLQAIEEVYAPQIENRSLAVSMEESQELSYSPTEGFSTAAETSFANILISMIRDIFFNVWDSFLHFFGNLLGHFLQEET